MTQLQASVSADSVRAVLDEVFSAAQYEWRLRPDPWRWLRQLIGEVMARLTQLEAEHPIAYYALVAGLTVLLAAILLHLGYLTWNAFRVRESETETGAQATREIRDSGWHRRRALELEALGRYQESLAHRFAALVALLDGKKVLRAHPSKTPAEYLKEAQLDAPGREALHAVVRRLYAHLFAGQPLNPALLAEFDRRAEEVTTYGTA